MASIINTDLPIQIDAEPAAEPTQGPVPGQVVPLWNTRQMFAPVSAECDELGFFFSGEGEDPAAESEVALAEENEAFRLIFPEPHLLHDMDGADGARMSSSQRVTQIMGLIDEAIAGRDRAEHEREEAIEARECASRAQKEALVHIELLNLQHEMLLEQNKKLTADRDDLEADLEEAATKVKDRTDQRNEAVKKLARTIHDRDTLSARLEDAIKGREGARCAVHALTRERDVAIDRLESIQRAHAETQARSLQQSAIIDDWKRWRAKAQDTLDESEGRAHCAQDLAQELVSTPWWSLRRRKALSMQIKSL